MKPITHEKETKHRLVKGACALILSLPCLASVALASDDQDLIAAIMEVAEVPIPPGSMTTETDSKLKSLERHLESLKAAAPRIPTQYRSLVRLHLFQQESDELEKNLSVGVTSDESLQRLQNFRKHLFALGSTLQENLLSDLTIRSELKLAKQQFDAIGSFFSSNLIAEDLALLEAIETTFACSRQDLGQCQAPELPLNRRQQFLLPAENFMAQYRFLAQTAWSHHNVIQNRWRSPALRTLTKAAEIPKDPRVHQDQRLLDDFRTTWNLKATLEKADVRRLMARASMRDYFESSPLYMKWRTILTGSPVVSSLFSYDEEPGLAIKLCSELDQHLRALQSIDVAIQAEKVKLLESLAAYENSQNVSILRSIGLIMETISRKLSEKSRLGVVSQTETDRLTTLSWLKLSPSTPIPDHEAFRLSLVFASIDEQYWTRDMPFSLRDILPTLKDLQLDGLSLLSGEAVPAFTQSIVQLQRWQSPYVACAETSPVTLVLELASTQNTEYLVLAR